VCTRSRAPITRPLYTQATQYNIILQLFYEIRTIYYHCIIAGTRHNIITRHIVNNSIVSTCIQCSNNKRVYGSNGILHLPAALCTGTRGRVSTLICITYRYIILLRLHIV